MKISACIARRTWRSLIEAWRCKGLDDRDHVELDLEPIFTLQGDWHTADQHNWSKNPKYWSRGLMPSSLDICIESWLRISGVRQWMWFVCSNPIPAPFRSPVCNISSWWVPYGYWPRSTWRQWRSTLHIQDMVQWGNHWNPLDLIGAQGIEQCPINCSIAINRDTSNDHEITNELPKNEEWRGQRQVKTSGSHKW